VPKTYLVVEGGGYNIENVDRNVRVVNHSLKSKNHVLKAPNSYENFLVFCIFFSFAHATCKKRHALI
jgi:hypothetical protein